MKVAITGTPGTGKTSVAAFLAEKGYEVRSFDELAEDFVVGYDDERECKIVDTEEMDKAFRNIKEEDIMFVEGHLSHMLSVDFVIVLRCEPSELEKRMKAKGWGEEKIRENLEAEAMDLILSQSCELHEKHGCDSGNTHNRGAPWRGGKPTNNKSICKSVNGMVNEITLRRCLIFQTCHLSVKGIKKAVHQNHEGCQEKKVMIFI